MHSISLQSSDSSIAVNDILGRIGFAASNETGSDALKVSALILAVAEDTFDASSNPTSLTFSTGHSETATEKMRIDSIGNVGIGTSTTTRKLTVQGNTSDNSAAVLIQADGLGSTTTDGLLLSQNNAGLGYLWNFENKGLVFGTNNAERIRIDEAGNVGIGTITPSEKLHVSGGDLLVDSIRPVTISTASNIVTSKKGNAGGWEFSHDAIGSAGTNSGGYGWYGTDDVLSRYWIGPAYDTASFNILYSNGNVGINILNPAYDLDLAGTARIEPTSHGMLIGRGSGASSIRATGADGQSEYLILDSNGNYLSLNHYTSDNIAMVYGGGNVGIATVSPTQKLHVTGNIKVDAGGIGVENDGVYMAFPGGGTDSNTASTTLGYLKVQLPVGWTSTMISFDLHVYEYNADSDAATRKFRIGGYNNAGGGGNWTKPIAVYDGDGLVDHNLKVHFGHDGTYSAIYISKMSTAGVDQGASSSWSYPQSFVSNVFGGYASTTMANWADSWDITFTTVLGTISQTLEVNRSFKLNDSSYVFNDLGNNVDVRIESENLDHLIHTDASKDEVVIYNAVGYGLNYATSEGWTESTESQTGYYGGDFSRNGGNGENSCEFGDLPNSMRGLIWKTRNNTTDSGADGGWNKDIEGLDPEKTYISIVYVRRVGSNTNGSFYHGCGSSSGQTETLAGVASTNPYFHSGALTSLPQDVWCVSIGIIHAHSDPVTTSTGIGGVYRLDTGARISFSNHTDFRMGPSTTTQRHRTYLYYDATGDSKLDWCWPGFYDVTSPEIVNFLNTMFYDHASNIDITDFNASSIITESEGISSNDNDTTLPTSAAVKDYVDNNTALVETVNGRLSLKETNPIPPADQTAKTTIYFVPYKGNQIALYSGSAWIIHSFSALSLSLSGYSADTNFDIFIYDNSGTLTLESVAWTDDTNRATALTTQDGVYVKSGATTRRYLGTIRTTTTTGQCEDSVNSRFVWNHYNQVKRYLRSGAVTSGIEGTGGHVYATNAWRAWYNNTTIGQAKHDYVLGLGLIVNASATGHVRHGYIDYAIDSTTAGATAHVLNGSNTFDMTLNATADLNVAAGYHFAQGIQYGVASSSIFHSIYIGTHFQG